MRKPKKTQRIFILKNGRKPLSEILSSKDSARSPLRGETKDEHGNIRYEPIRWSRAHNSPFIKDQQDGIPPILDPIVFVDGVLICDVRSDDSLIKFLEVHPKNGTTFEELDHEKEAREELDVMKMEAKAMNHAMTASIGVIEKIVRIMTENKDISNLTSEEVRRDAMVYAKRSPEEYLSVIDDPDTSRKNIVALAFEMKLLTLRNNDSEVYYNLKDNKSRMVNIPHGSDPYEFIEEYFLTTDGIDAYNLLESRIESLQAQ